VWASENFHDGGGGQVGTPARETEKSARRLLLVKKAKVARI